MAGEWPELTLEEAGVTLLDCVHKTLPDAGEGYPYIAIPQMKGGTIELDGVRRITKTHFDEWTQKTLPQPDDIILSRRCNPGVTAYVPESLECALGRNLVLLRADGERIHPPFLRWLCRGRDWWIQVGNFINVGATFDSLKCAEIPKFSLPLPPIEDQRAIASILGALDDKIELNRRMNATLESLARAIFKSWFVDFDPVRMKSEGRSVTSENIDPELLPFTLPISLFDLFPSTFQDSELGKIPQGWEALSLGEVCEKYGGGIKTGPFGTSLNAREYQTTGTPAIAVRDIRHGYIEVDERTPLLSDETIERLSIYKVQNGDILFGRKGAVERSSYIGDAEAGWLMGSDCIRLRLPADLAPVIWSHGFRTPAQVAWIQQYATGTTMASLNQGILKRIPMVIPPSRLLARLSPVFQTVQQKLEANRFESLTLSALRDTLLPKLLSGELPVPAALTATEEALA